MVRILTLVALWVSYLLCAVAGVALFLLSFVGGGRGTQEGSVLIFAAVALFALFSGAAALLRTKLGR